MPKSAPGEQPIWSGTPSQLINLRIYVPCALLCWLVVPLFYALWKWLEVRSTQYELTTQRLRLHSGVLSKDLQDLELYRIKDYTVHQTFSQRMLGVADIHLETSDRTTPHVFLHSVPDAVALVDVIRTNVEALRRSRGVRELDYDLSR